MENGVIEFLAPSDHYDDAAKPVPATKAMPDWFEQLEPDLEGGGKTAKRCMSFLDAMTMGWIIPVPFDVELSVAENCRSMDLIEQNEDFPPLGAHGLDQLGRDDHPQLPGAVVKFRQPWAIRTPEGVSVLITSPMNRHEPRFQTFSGVVDTDGYLNTVHIPALWTEPGYEGVVEAGTPLVQVIPFTRDGIVADGEIRSMSESEERKMSKLRDLIENSDGLYRNAVWQHKQQARVVSQE